MVNFYRSAPKATVWKHMSPVRCVCNFCCYQSLHHVNPILSQWIVLAVDQRSIVNRTKIASGRSAYTRWRYHTTSINNIIDRAFSCLNLRKGFILGQYKKGGVVFWSVNNRFMKMTRLWKSVHEYLRQTMVTVHYFSSIFMESKFIDREIRLN